MVNEVRHSPGPWQWTEFGVLSDANGEALLDCEDWQVSPEDAILLAAAPGLLDWVARIVGNYGNKLDKSDLDQGQELIRQATDPGYRK
jgi:hypothetical protein